MKHARGLTAVLALLAIAQAPAPAPAVLAADTPVALETAQPLSSKVAVKGDIVDLRVAADVQVCGGVVVPKGTRAVGQITDARAKGAMGMSGYLTVRPLYLTLGARTVRLAGAAERRARVAGGAVLGLVTLGAMFTGRSAVIPEGTRIDAVTASEVRLDAVAR